MEKFDRIQLFLFGAVLFFTPWFTNLVPILYYLGFLLLIIQKPKQLISIKPDKIFFLSVGMFFLTIVSLFNTADTDLGVVAIDKKIAFILLPLWIYANQEIIRKNYRYLLGILLAGTVASALFCIFDSSVEYIIKPKATQFHASEFSELMHPGYLGLFLSVGFIINYYLGMHFLPFKIPYARQLQLLIYAILGTAIFMTASKISIAILFGLLIFIGFDLIKKRGFNKILILRLVIISSLLIIGFVSLPYTANRFTKLIEGSQLDRQKASGTESYSDRMYSWEACVELIKESPFIGYGPGDVNQELQKYYLANYPISFAEKGINAHNQFLQTQLGLGILGTIVLIMLLILGFKYAMKDNKFGMAVIMIICLLHCMFESILERTTGTLFFVLLICIISITRGLNIQLNQKQ